MARAEQSGDLVEERLHLLDVSAVSLQVQPDDQGVGPPLVQRASIVATDGRVSDGPYPEIKKVIGGFSIIDVPARTEALDWAAKIAVACHCAQEVPEFMDDPTF